MRNRRGLASTLAIILIGLVGMALVAIAGQFADRAKRAAREGDAAQLRQMLVAGTIYAREGGATVELPGALKSEGGSVTMKEVSETESRREVDVEAGLREMKWGQRVTVEKQGEKWRVVSVVLSSAAPVRK